MWNQIYDERKKASTHVHAGYSFEIVVFGMVIFGVRGAGRRWMVCESHPHTQNWNRGLTGLALGLCVCVFGCGGGTHIHCTGEVACGMQLMATVERLPHTNPARGL